MNGPNLYYAIVPIEGLHLTRDFRIHSAELYGCPPDYIPQPKIFSVFRDPYELYGSLYVQNYLELTDLMAIDETTKKLIMSLSNKRLKDFSCVGFEFELDSPGYTLSTHREVDNSLFQLVLQKAERILDVLRFCIYIPGEEKSIGRAGAIGNGVNCVLIGQDDIPPKFIARKISRYQLVQEPIKLTERELGLIYYDLGFRLLAYSACSDSIETPIILRIFEALRAFRESREMQNWEARFRHLAVIAEDLAKQDEREKLYGRNLRDRISRIIVNGWGTYNNYSSSKLLPTGLSKEQQKQFYQRRSELDWGSKEKARTVVDDLWGAVRNPLSHSLITSQSLNRDPLQDMIDMEHIVITIVYGLSAAYEVEELVGKTAYEFLIEKDEV